MDAIDALKKAGLTVPNDVSVTGFDDISLAYEFVPALTSVRFSSLEIGRAAVDMLLDLIEEQARDRIDTLAPRAPIEPKHLSVPVEFITRASTSRLQPLNS